MTCVLSALTAAVVSWPALSVAKTVEYVNMVFEIGPTWGCNIEETTLVCSKRGDKASTTDLMVVAASEKRTDDSLENFERALKSRKAFKFRTGEELPSKVLGVRRTTISGKIWVDALHFQSEAKGCTTRYLGTVVGGTAYLVTITAKQEQFDSFNREVLAILEKIQFKETKYKAPIEP